MNFSSSRQLIKNVHNFLSIHQVLPPVSMKKFNQEDILFGWGRKKSGKVAVEIAKREQVAFTLLEDGFIRSLGLGVDGSPSYSLIEDDVGIYYDATSPSSLENILNNYNFEVDTKLMQTAKEAMGYLVKNNVSKYNNAPEVSSDFFTADEARILVIAQTAGDASLKYGMLDDYSTDDMINTALSENPNATVYLKIHPDVLSRKKKSDIDIESAKQTCIIIDDDINPISLLKYFDKVYTKTSGMGFEALLVGCECVCFGMPFYAGWGITDDRSKCERRTRKLSIEEIFAAAYILYTRYYNPYSQKPSDVIDTIKSIVKYRNLYRQNDGDLYFFGFTWWKKWFTKSFFHSLKKNHILFCFSLEDAIKKGLNPQSKIFIWGKKPFNEVEQYAQDKNIALHRVEDGFIRSVSLGSDLTKAYSLVVDSRGIYFDPTQESDLEHLLNTYIFDEQLINRAKDLQDYLIENKISKYNIYQDKQIKLQDFRKGQTVIMVPGQVEDDASIIYGADGMTNLELLEQTRKNRPDAYIIYKPHPDVLVGNRKGNIANSIALQYCDAVITDSSLDSVLELSDEIHTMTSLVGFEALIRGKKVYTYGLPFYAGWGLTIDAKYCSRRTRQLTLNELVAAAFILYPRYIHPRTNQLCEIETLLLEIDKEKKRYNHNLVYKFYIRSRNIISRKIQFLLKVIVSE